MARTVAARPSQPFCAAEELVVLKDDHGEYAFRAVFAVFSPPDSRADNEDVAVIDALLSGTTVRGSSVIAADLIPLSR